jgi:hypothetical protein
VLKSSGRLEGDHATHFKGWIKKLITWNLIWKCSYADDIIEQGLMMCMSFVMDGNRQENKRLLVKHKALKWVKVNSTFPKRSL